MPWFEFIAGYAFAVFAGALLIRLVDNSLTARIGEAESSDQSTLLGILERVLYVASFQFGKPAFIAIWLILKAIGQWRFASHDDAASPAHRYLRYEKWLITNALSILFGGVGYLMIVGIGRLPLGAVVVLPGILSAFTLAIWMWLARRRYVRIAGLLVVLLLTVALAAWAGR